MTFSYTARQRHHVNQDINPVLAPGATRPKARRLAEVLRSRTGPDTSHLRLPTQAGYVVGFAANMAKLSRWTFS